LLSAAGRPKGRAKIDEAPTVTEQDIQRVEAHLKRTFGNPKITVKLRTKPKDSAEVYVGEEFLGVLYKDEDEDGSFMFEMAILAEDLES
jgi:hypothetical protein